VFYFFIFIFLKEIEMSKKTVLKDANLLPSDGAVLPVITPPLSVKDDDKDVSIQLTRGGSFTRTHAQTNVALVPAKAWTHLYGNELDPRLEPPTRSQLLGVDQIKVITTGNSNTAWSGDGNPDYNEIKISMMAGFKLYVPCVAVFWLDDGKYMLMDRRTTHKILVDELEYTNLICDVYKPANNPATGMPYTYDELSEGGVFDDFGITANVKRTLPAGKVKKKDIKNYINQQISKGRFKLDSFGMPEYDDIIEQINNISGSQGFQSKTRHNLACEIVNQHDASNTVKAWLTPKDVKSWIERTDNFVDVEPTYYPDGNVKSFGVHYEIIGTSQYAASVKRTAAVAVSKKDTDIRIILHTEVLNAYDQEGNYWKKIRDFRTAYEKIKQDISIAYFDSASPSDRRIKLYGVLPAVASIHSDLDSLVYFTGDEGYEDGDDDSDGETIKYGESMNWKQK